MAGEIETALEVLNERKDAIANGRTDFTIDNEEYAALLSGFDLDPEELNCFGVSAAVHYVRLLQAGNAVQGVLKAATLDGLAIGLLLAEERQKAGQS